MLNVLFLFRYLEDSVGESPVVTPVATPTVSPTPSTVLVPTPGVSEQDLPDSEKTGVETPEVTVYIRDSTPDESMQEVEDDLKE